MTGEEQEQQNPPKNPPRTPRVIPGVGGRLDPPSDEGKALKLELRTSAELATLSSTPELAQLKEKQGAKGQKKKEP
jgi:hypothetical protein